MKDFLGYKDTYLSTKRWYNLLRLFSPLKCMFCGEVEFTDDGPFCPECYEKFLQLLSKPCPYCGCSGDECKCSVTAGVKKHFFMFWYHGEFVTEIVSKLKYDGEKRYITFLGELLAQKIKESCGKINFTGICYVPRAKSSIKRIGFDQAKLLAECVAFYLNLPVFPCLERKKEGKEQKKLSGAERRKNIKQKYAVSINNLVNESGEIHSKLLLIDDVVTTGSTIQECSYILRRSGVSSVCVASIAKTPFKKRKRMIKRTKKL